MEPELEKELLLTSEDLDAVFAKWSEATQGVVSKELGNTYSQAIAKAQLTHAFEVLGQKGYGLVKVDEKLRENIAKITCSIRKDDPDYCSECKHGCPDEWIDEAEEVDQIISLIKEE